MEAASNQELVVAIVSPDRAIHEAIASALNGGPDIDALWTLADYPNSAALSQIGKVEGGCVVYLDFSDPMRARAVAAELDSSYPMASIIAVHPARQPQDLIELMQLGIREIVKLPIVQSDVLRPFHRVGRKLKPGGAVEDGGRLYAFLPAKPGSGASTLAMHCAAASARLADDRTLLLDFDFRLGMTSFLLKLSGNYSVLDAIAQRGQLDSDLWDRLVCRRGKLDILGSAPVEFGGVNPEMGAVELVNSARRAYRTLYVDLPGEMRQYELETMHRAQECVLVATPDIGTLHMAKRKAEVLQSQGLNSKVSVVMNRVEKGSRMSIKDVEAILQLPIRFSVPAAEREISEATQSGQPLDGRTALTAQIEAIARRLTPGAPVAGGSKPRQFLEMFSVSEVRDRSRWGW